MFTLNLSFLSEFKPHHLTLFITSYEALTLLSLAVHLSISEPSKKPGLHESFLAQWIEHLTSYQMGNGLIPIRDSDFVPMLVVYDCFHLVFLFFK